MLKIEAAQRLEQHELFAMSGLRADKTGLPNSIYIWFSTDMGMSHGPRIKVSNTRGKYNKTDNFSMSISDNPIVVAGTAKDFKPYELVAIGKWILLNKDLLIKFWYSEDMDDDDVKPYLKKI